MLPNNKIKFKGKSTVMKELQRTIALQCYNEVFKGNSRSTHEKHTNFYSLFHGNPNDEDSYGFAKQLLEGLNMFTPLFEREANNALGLTPLVLHQYYHCMKGTEIIVSNESKHEGITITVLTATSLQNKQLISGRTIYDAAKLVVTNARKAMAIVHNSEYQQYVEQGTLPSGKEIEDYYYFIRQEMYKLLKTPSSGDDDDTGNGEEDKNEEEEVTEGDGLMPDDYFFPGFFSFALFGPILPNNQSLQYRAECFLISDDKSKKKGRRQQQKEDTTKEDKKRSSADVIEGRGLSVRDSMIQEQNDIMRAAIAEQANSRIFSVLRDEYASRKATIEKLLYLAVAEEEKWYKMLKPEHFENPDAYGSYLPLQKWLSVQREVDRHKRGLEHLEHERQEATKKLESKYEEVLETALFKKRRYEYVCPNVRTIPNTINIVTNDDNNGNNYPLSNLTSPMPVLGSGVLLLGPFCFPKGG